MLGANTMATLRAFILLWCSSWTTSAIKLMAQSRSAASVGGKSLTSCAHSSSVWHCITCSGDKESRTPLGNSLNHAFHTKTDHKQASERLLIQPNYEAINHERALISHAEPCYAHWTGWMFSQIKASKYPIKNTILKLKADGVESNSIRAWYSRGYHTVFDYFSPTLNEEVQQRICFHQTTLIKPAKQWTSIPSGTIPLFSWSLTYSSWLFSAFIRNMPSAYKQMKHKH